MVRSNTLVFCIVILTMAATYCTGWSKQQDNLGINLLMERRLAKREFQDQLFGKVDASRRLLRTIRVLDLLEDPIHDDPIDDDPIDDDPIIDDPIIDDPKDDDPAPKPYKPPKPPCHCPCGSGTSYACTGDCDTVGCACPCPCGYPGYVKCPQGCIARSSSSCKKS